MHFHSTQSLPLPESCSDRHPQASNVVVGREQLVLAASRRWSLIHRARMEESPGFRAPARITWLHGCSVGPRSPDVVVLLIVALLFGPVFKLLQASQFQTVSPIGPHPGSF